MKNSFEVIKGFASKAKSNRAYANVIHMDGSNATWTDGYSLYRAPSATPAGVYRPDMQIANVKYPDTKSVTKGCDKILLNDKSAANAVRIASAISLTAKHDVYLRLFNDAVAITATLDSANDAVFINPKYLNMFVTLAKTKSKTPKIEFHISADKGLIRLSYEDLECYVCAIVQNQ